MLQGHPQAVPLVSWSPDDRRLVTCRWDDNRGGGGEGADLHELCWRLSSCVCLGGNVGGAAGGNVGGKHWSESKRTECECDMRRMWRVNGCKSWELGERGQ